MELNRLKELPSNFNTELFNKLYKETQGLRVNLSKQIDERRYGVSKDIVLSWFDDKFIFVFNKYFEEREEKHLKYSLIQALQFFKCRILRKAYTGESEIYSNVINLSDDDSRDLINIIPDSTEPDNKTLFLELAMGFFKQRLSEDALLILDLQIDPPQYLIERSRSKNHITSKLLVQYLDLDMTKSNVKYIDSIKDQITKYTKEAQEYFNSQALSIN